MSRTTRISFALLLSLVLVCHLARVNAAATKRVRTVTRAGQASSLAKPQSLARQSSNSNNEQYTQDATITIHTLAHSRPHVMDRLAKDDLVQRLSQQQQQDSSTWTGTIYSLLKEASTVSTIALTALVLFTPNIKTLYKDLAQGSLLANLAWIPYLVIKSRRVDWFDVGFLTLTLSGDSWTLLQDRVWPVVAKMIRTELWNRFWKATWQQAHYFADTGLVLSGSPLSQWLQTMDIPDWLQSTQQVVERIVERGTKKLIQVSVQQNISGVVWEWSQWATSAIRQHATTLM
jgi:hypothetical protein